MPLLPPPHANNYLDDTLAVKQDEVRLGLLGARGSICGFLEYWMECSLTPPWLLTRFATYSSPTVAGLIEP
jgi:hypothetical protein